MQPVKDYVDKYIAHLDVKRGRIEIPTHDDLDAAIDALISVFRRYRLLVTGRDSITFVPSIQYDWLAPLRVAWLRPDFRPIEPGVDETGWPKASR